MAIGNSRAEQELNARLVQELVIPEVLAPMSQIGWGHGTPPPPVRTTTPADGQPAPTEGAPKPVAQQPGQVQDGLPVPVKPAAAPADQPKADTPTVDDLVQGYESLRSPETGLIAGKYKTVQEAIKGGVHLTHMAKQAMQERDEARRQLAELTAGTSTLTPRTTATPVAPQFTQPTPAPALTAARTKLDKVLSDINENGGVLSEELARQFATANQEVAEAAAAAKLQETLDSRHKAEQSEKAEWDKVDAYMRDKHPASERFSEEISLHIGGDPLLAKAVQALLRDGDKQGATELAWLSFERAHGAQVVAQATDAAQKKEDDLAAREQVRKELLVTARKDAGVVTGSAGGAGGHENNGPRYGSREEIAAAADAMRREGMAPGSPAAMRWRQLVIGPSLPQSIFGS